jgi:hypothetical protein
MRIGYARVSTNVQNLDLQRDALKRLGCKRIIEESASGGKVQRSGLERVQEMLRQGDVLAVWRLDRLGGSLKHLIEVMGGLEDQGIGFHSVTDSIETTTPGGKLVADLELGDGARGGVIASSHRFLTPSRVVNAKKIFAGRPVPLCKDSAFPFMSCRTINRSTDAPGTQCGSDHRSIPATPASGRW